MNSKTYSRGFTLIELLVVIAIIGILTSVVLASLNSARSKGGDAGVKSNLASIRTQAAVYYDDNNSYGTVLAAATCAGQAGLFADSNVSAAIDSAESAGGGNATCAAGSADVTITVASSWAVAVPLKSDATVYWCVDSAGKAATSSSVSLGGAAGTAAACPAS